MKMECQRWSEMPLILGRSGTQYVAMVTKQLRSNCEAHLVESYCKESKLAGISFFIIFDQNLVEYTASSLGQFAYFKNLNISGTKKEIFERGKHRDRAAFLQLGGLNILSVRRRHKRPRGVRGHVPRKIFKINASRVAKNTSQYSRHSEFFYYLSG